MTRHPVHLLWVWTRREGTTGRQMFRKVGWETKTWSLLLAGVAMLNNRVAGTFSRNEDVYQDSATGNWFTNRPCEKGSFSSSTTSPHSRPIIYSGLSAFSSYIFSFFFFLFFFSGRNEICGILLVNIFYLKPQGSIKSSKVSHWCLCLTLFNKESTLEFI